LCELRREPLSFSSGLPVGDGMREHEREGKKNERERERER